MEYLPFTVTEFNDFREDKKIVLKSDQGHLYVRVGKLDISIKQSDDGLGVVIDCLDAELCEQELGTMTIWYDDIEWNDEQDDSKYPIH